MGEFFKWISTLPKELSWGMFLGVAILMAVVPYLSTFIRWIWIVLSNEKREVYDFSYRIIPNYNAGRANGRKFFITNSENHLLYQGMKIWLCWNVSGSIRVDLYKFSESSNCWILQHRRMKGNSKVTIVDNVQNRYLLKVYFPFNKKIETELKVTLDEVKRLFTMNLSGEDSFGQPHHQLKKLSLVDSVHASLQFSKLKIHPLNRITMIRLTSQMKRYYSSLNRLNWMNNPSDAQSQLKKRVQNQNLVKTYKFRPARYNEFIRAYQDNNKPPLNK